MQIDIVPALVAVLGAGGLGAFIRELVSGLTKVLGGMSARESKRKVDIVEQRDIAIAREARAWRQVDAEAEKRRKVHEWAARLSRQLIMAGIEPDPEPVLGRTVTREELNRIQEEESP